MQLSENIDLYEDVFFPPTDYEKDYKIEYEIDWVEMTTWSLSKDWLRLIAAMISSANAKNAHKAAITRPNNAIKAYCKDKKATGNSTPFPFHIFYDEKCELELEDASFGMTSNGKLCTFLFEQCCSPVISTHLFHPKIILVQFKEKNGEANYKYRLLISSHNLTWSSYIESGVILESYEDDSPCDNNSPGKAISTFFKDYYRDYCPSNSSKLRYDILEKTRFRVIKKNGDVVDDNPELYFGSKVNLLNDVMLKKIKEFKRKNGSNYTYYLRISSMNPQVDQQFHKQLLKSDFTDINLQFICNFKDMYLPDTNSQNNRWIRKQTHDNFWYLSRKSNNDQKTGSEGQTPIPIHLKHYMFWGCTEDNSRSSVLCFIGSANYSNGGLIKQNEEALLVFEATQDDLGPGTKHLSITTEFGSYGGNSKQTLAFYHPDFVDNPDIDVDPEDEELSRSINVDIQDALFIPAKNGKGGGTLEFRIQNKENVAISFWPALCSESRAHSLAPGQVVSKCSITLKKSEFSRLFHIRKENEDDVYTKMVCIFDSKGEPDLEWHGKEYFDIVNNLSFESINCLGDLIENQAFFDPSDNVFEKLTKCRIFLGTSDVLSLIQTAKTELENWRSALESDFEALQALEKDDSANDLDDEELIEKRNYLRESEGEIRDNLKILKHGNDQEPYKDYNDFHKLLKDLEDSLATEESLINEIKNQSAS